MRCPRCRRDHPETVVQCDCGFKFSNLTGAELDDWFDEVRDVLETAYAQADTPWEQSGKRGGFEAWTRLRIPVSECIDHDGTFLDIGCANGFLLECLLEWTRHKAVHITPYGLDYAAELVTMAQKRLPDYAANIYHGNAWDWQPLNRFDYVRSELVYVPGNLQADYVARLRSEYLKPGGKLLLAQYRSRNEDLTRGWLTEPENLQAIGLTPDHVERYTRGFDGAGNECVRVVVIPA